MRPSQSSSSENVCQTPVILGLGSNKGDSFKILREAVVEISSLLTGLRQAPLYETSPVGVLDQRPFINTCVYGLYTGSLFALLETLQAIERRFGRERERERRWGERTLDIDIILAGDLVLNRAPVLEIPHPRFTERRFVLVPLLALCPGAKDPRTGESLAACLALLSDQEQRVERIAA